MDRNREARRASIVGSNGFTRRRHRTNSRTDSPDGDGGALEVQESVRLRDRVKKDRDRERERERDLRARSSRSKRRRAERWTSNREEIEEDESAEDSLNDEEDEEDEENAAAATGVKLLAPPEGSVFIHHQHSHVSNNHHSQSGSFSLPQNNSNSTCTNNHIQHRNSFSPNSSSGKALRAPSVWKTGDEMIGVSVPRKARSANTKRSIDWISSSVGVAEGEQILRQATSPARQGPTLSPSSSKVSNRKKLKPNSVNNGGPKLKPPKVSPRPCSSNPEELEIEIAEVLSGLMTRSQGPSSKEEESRENNRLNSDLKSHNSSPISNSTVNANPNLGPNSSSVVAAPKRKKPRQAPDNLSYGTQSGAMSAKLDIDQMPKREVLSPDLKMISGTAVENGFATGGNLVNSQGQLGEPLQPKALDSTKLDPELKCASEESRERRDLVAKKKASSPMDKESPSVKTEDSNKDVEVMVTASLAATMIKANTSGGENQREEKLEIDLMAEPLQVRTSPGKDKKSDLGAAAVDQKPVLSVDLDLRQLLPEVKDYDIGKVRKDPSTSAAAEEKREEKRGKDTGKEAESIENKVRIIDLRLDLEKPERDGNTGINPTRNKVSQQHQQHMPVKPTREEPTAEKSGHSMTSMPLPVSMPGWPGGLPPMGCMAPFQVVVSMDGSTVAPTPFQPVISQARPKRCATHCHIARNIHYLQQFMKMNPFWPAPAAPPSLFGSKPCNFNAMPMADLLGNPAARGVSNLTQDKGPSLANAPNNGGKEKSSHPAKDSAQQKQHVLIQQALPPVVPPNNLLGPTFVLPFNQQQTAVAARPNIAAKSAITGAASDTPGSGSTSASSAAAMSFHYPNIAANDTQYLAILQNNAFPFPIPAVGAPPNYRGAPAHAMPLFNGSLYSSQMIHPSQLQHLQPPSAQAHQNASASSGSASSLKHLQSLQQRSQSNSAANGSESVSLQNFPGQKTEQSKQLQQSHNQYVPSSRPRHLDGKVGSEGSPSTAESREPRSSVNIYGQNFVMPIHPQNFTLMTAPPALASGNNSQNEKKSHQSQQAGLKPGMDSSPTHGFAMTFGPINGTTSGGSSVIQNHAMFNSSEATRHSIQMMAAATVANQVAQKNYQTSGDGKSVRRDSSATDDERRKVLSGVGQSIAFTRSDTAAGPVTSTAANSLIESGSSRSTRPMSVEAVNVPNAHHIQAQIQQQQMMQLKQQQLAATALSRNKVPVTSNGIMYSEHLNPSSAKFPNVLSGFPQKLVQSGGSSSSSPAQSPRWKGSVRAPTSQSPSSLASSTGTSLKNVPQQYSRPHSQMHNQISFGGNQKPATSSQQAQGPLSSNPAPSSPMMVGSPTTSSISKGASGSPRSTISSSGNNKMGQATSLPTHQSKNLPAISSQKSPSILGNHLTASSGSAMKTQMQQHQQQQQKTMQQGQLFFSNPYAPSQSPQSATTVTSSGYNMPRKQPDQHQQVRGAPVTASTGMLSLSPPTTLASVSTSDPAKAAVAAATSNATAGGLPSQGIAQASQFSGFLHVHPIPGAVHVKVPAEQKQPAGNDNIQLRQREKK